MIIPEHQRKINSEQWELQGIHSGVNLLLSEMHTEKGRNAKAALKEHQDKLWNENTRLASGNPARKMFSSKTLMD